MRIEIINTGSELLLGRVLNTHQQWLGRQLSDMGYLVERQTAVPDNATEIQHVLREALSRSDLVIMTGGLGPTSRDLSREAVAALLGLRLVPNQEVLADIKEFFARRNRQMLSRTDVQALVPEGALVLRNKSGTAPGLALKIPAGRFGSGPRAAWLVMLPGPPNELRPMFTEQVLPLLKRELPKPELFVCRTLKTTGLGESLAENAIAESLRSLVEAGLEIGYCARPGEVDVRLCAQGPQAERLVLQAEETVRGAIGEYIFGLDEAELPAVVIKLLRSNRKTLVVAESCTGGNLAHNLTNVSGASEVFLGGWITYSNEAKLKWLGVKPETLAQHGAVSEATAREMADRARLGAGADYAISVTGIAGPTGGSAEKPVGTVFIGLAGPVKTEVAHRLNPQGREMFKYITTQQALELLRRELVK